MLIVSFFLVVTNDVAVYAFSFCVNMCSRVSLGCIPRSGIAGLDDNSIF